jgi:hypothetical protein
MPRPTTASQPDADGDHPSLHRALEAGEPVTSEIIDRLIPKRGYRPVRGRG